MALDLKIEIFAYNCFYDAWLEIGVKNTEMNIFQIYRDECIKDNSYIEACDEMFIRAITCRCFLFSTKYWEEIDFESVLKWKCLSDCFDYLTHLWDREDLFGYLTVFEKMFATCAFVRLLFSRIYSVSLIDVVNYGHFIWAMYFDKFTEKFYKEGGWNELKKIAKTYDLLFDFLKCFSGEKCLNVFKEASINYRRFKNAYKNANCNRMYNGKIHISIFWIKFQTEHFKKRETIPSNYEDFADIFDVELLLQDLKLIINFSSEDESNSKILEDTLQGQFFSTGMTCTKTFGNSEKNKSYNLQNNLRNCKNFYEIPKAKNNFETGHRGEILTLTRKVENCEMDKIKNYENVKKSSSEMGMPEMKISIDLNEYLHSVCNNLQDRTKSPQVKINIKNSSKINDLDLHYFTKESFDNKDEKNFDKILSQENNKTQSEALNADRIFSINQKKNTELLKENASTHPYNPKVVGSKDELIKSRDEREDLNCSSESNFSSKFEETFNKNIELTCTLNVNKLSATESEKNEILKRLLDVNEYAKNSDERINNNNEQDKVKHEQKDPGIIKFLRMILVLGDRQGIQQILGTLQSNQDKKNSSSKVK